MVPIYLLAFACFRTARLAGAGTKRRELTPLRGFDLMTAGLLTMQHTGFFSLAHSATAFSSKIKKNATCGGCPQNTVEECFSKSTCVGALVSTRWVVAKTGLYVVGGYKSPSSTYMKTYKSWELP